jgi:hypothetical protein
MSMPTYAAITPPATVAKPPVITAISSDMVMPAMYGLMSSGASVWPRKMLPAADSVSAPDVRMVRIITHAKPFTTACMTPK